MKAYIIHANGNMCFDLDCTFVLFDRQEAYEKLVELQMDNPEAYMMVSNDDGRSEFIVDVPLELKENILKKKCDEAAKKAQVYKEELIKLNLLSSGEMENIVNAKFERRLSLEDLSCYEAIKKHEHDLKYDDFYKIFDQFLPSANSGESNYTEILLKVKDVFHLLVNYHNKKNRMPESVVDMITNAYNDVMHKKGLFRYDVDMDLTDYNIKFISQQGYLYNADGFPIYRQIRNRNVKKDILLTDNDLDMDVNERFNTRHMTGKLYA